MLSNLGEKTLWDIPDVEKMLLQLKYVYKS